jgi:hypothetical protein
MISIIVCGVPDVMSGTFRERFAAELRKVSTRSLPNENVDLFMETSAGSLEKFQTLKGKDVPPKAAPTPSTTRQPMRGN